MKNAFRKFAVLAFRASNAIRATPKSERGALTIEWGQIIAIIVVVLAAVGLLLQSFIPGFFQGILAKLGN